jgi:hypothetical protein
LWSYDVDTNTPKELINLNMGGDDEFDMEFGADGLLYAIGSDRWRKKFTHLPLPMYIYDPATNTKKSVFINMKSNSSGRFLTHTTDGSGLIYIMNGSSDITVYDTITGQQRNLPSLMAAHWSIGSYDMAFGPGGLLYITIANSKLLRVYDPVSNTEILPPIDTGRGDGFQSVVHFNGLLYITDSSGILTSYNPTTKKVKDLATFRNPSSPWKFMAVNHKKVGGENLITISLTLRTKNQYRKDRPFKKKDYHSGNFNLDKTDKYKRDTFTTSVLVRNLAL